MVSYGTCLQVTDVYQISLHFSIFSLSSSKNAHPVLIEGKKICAEIAHNRDQKCTSREINKRGSSSLPLHAEGRSKYVQRLLKEHWFQPIKLREMIHHGDQD